MPRISHARTARRSITLLTSLALLAAIGSCGNDPGGIVTGTVLNFAGQRRGQLQIGFINNTFARAIFTFGGWDPTDEDSTPVFGQTRIEPRSSSNQIVQNCRRRFSIGGEDFIRIVQGRGQNITDQNALVTGVNFSLAPPNDPLAASPTEGTANAVTIDLGFDYECTGLLLFTFEEDSSVAGGFRIDYRYFPRDDS